MAYTSGLLKYRIQVLNRTKATAGKFGLDSAGVEWTSMGCVWANVEWQKGKGGMREGALDSYAVVMIRMRWTPEINMRSRIVYEGDTYQIVPETFHADRQANTIQFLAQLLVNETYQQPVSTSSLLRGRTAGEI